MSISACRMPSGSRRASSASASSYVRRAAGAYPLPLHRPVAGGGAGPAPHGAGALRGRRRLAHLRRGVREGDRDVAEESGGVGGESGVRKAMYAKALALFAVVGK